MSNYIVSIKSHPISNYGFDYDVVRDDKNTVDNIKKMLSEYYGELLPFVKFKFEDKATQIKVSRAIQGVLDKLVSCETVDDINGIDDFDIIKTIPKKKKSVAKVIEPDIAKKKVKRVKFF